MHFWCILWVLTIRNWPKSLILAILTCMKLVWLWKVEDQIDNLICYKMSTILFYYIFLIWELNKHWSINEYLWSIIELSMNHFNEHSMNLHCETLYPAEMIVQWTTICIHWKFSEYIISISEITKGNVHKFNMVLILKLLNAPCTCFTFGMRTNQIYV